MNSGDSMEKKHIVMKDHFHYLCNSGKRCLFFAQASTQSQSMCEGQVVHSIKFPIIFKVQKNLCNIFIPIV